MSADTKELPKPVVAPWLIQVDGASGLAAGRCLTCERWHLPLRPACPWCASTDLATAARRTGTIVAATTTFLPVPGGEGSLHTVVLVDMGDGMQAAGRGRGSSDALTPGTEVTVDVQSLNGGGFESHCFAPSEVVSHA